MKVFQPFLLSFLLSASVYGCTDKGEAIQAQCNSRCGCDDIGAICSGSGSSDEWVCCNIFGCNCEAWSGLTTGNCQSLCDDYMVAAGCSDSRSGCTNAPTTTEQCSDGGDIWCISSPPNNPASDTGLCEDDRRSLVNETVKALCSFMALSDDAQIDKVSNFYCSQGQVSGSFLAQLKPSVQ